MAWSLGLGAIVCLVLIPFVIVVAFSRPDFLGFEAASRVVMGLVAAPFVLIPTALCLGDWIQDRSRHRPHHCPRCGYDLRGTTGRRCSECGEAV